MSQPLTLGVLDFFPVWPGQTAAEVLQDTICLAPAIEKLGFSRLWVGEHQSPSVAHCSSTLLVGLLAGVTSSLKIGTGGLLLAKHDPLQVARDFKLLSCLFPDRIDLGIARGVSRASAADGEATQETHLLDYHSRLSELTTGLRRGDDPRLPPMYTYPPSIWILGSGELGGALAAAYGAQLCIAHFLTKEISSIRPILETYHRNYDASSSLVPRSNAALAIAVICEEAEVGCQNLNSDGPVQVRNIIRGTAAHCRQQILDLSAATGVHDFMILELSETPEKRFAAYSRLAHALLT